MPGADAEIDERLAFALSVKAVNVIGAKLKLERRGHTVVGLKLVALRRLRVFVQINESRRNHEIRSVDRCLALQRLSADGANHATADAEIAHGIKPGFRVHDAPALNNYVEGLLGIERCSHDHDEHAAPTHSTTA